MNRESSLTFVGWAHSVALMRGEGRAHSASLTATLAASAFLNWVRMVSMSSSPMRASSFLSFFCSSFSCCAALTCFPFFFGMAGGGDAHERRSSDECGALCCTLAMAAQHLLVVLVTLAVAALAAEQATWAVEGAVKPVLDDVQVWLQGDEGRYGAERARGAASKCGTRWSSFVDRRGNFILCVRPA